MLSVLILIPFWNRFGTVLGAKISFGGILGASWKPWEHLGSTSGQSWGLLGMRGGIVAASWQHLGNIFAQFWVHFGCLGSILGAPWDHLGRILEHFGSILHTWEHLGRSDAIWDRFWVPKRLQN